MTALTPEQLTLIGSLLVGIATTLLLVWVTPLWDALARRHLADLEPRMRDVGLDTTKLPLLLRLWAAGLIGAAAIIGLVLGYPLMAVPVVFLIYRLPRTLVQGLIDRRRIQLRDQLVTGCVALANATRAGLALPQGVEAIVPETPEPLAGELRRIHGEFQRGRPFAESIRDTQQRLKLDSFTLFASAILVCLARGGKVTEALERIAESLQENQRLERKLESDTASGRLVVRILALCPLAFLLLFGSLDPVGTSLLFTTIIGQGVLLLAAALTWVAVQWAHYLLRLEGS